jgi:YidC/Oxa1 family membrane protein insertase
MAKEPNRLLRVIVPLVLFVAGGGIIFYAVMKNSATKPAAAPATAGSTPAPAPAPTPATAAAAPGTTSAPATPTPTPAASANPTLSAPPTTPPTTSPTAPTTPAANATYSAKTYPFTGYDPIGSETPKDKGGTYELEARFSSFGAGVERLTLANHFTTIQNVDHEVIQQFRALPAGLVPDPRAGTCGFAMNKVEIDGKVVELGLTPTAKETFWKQTAPGAFEAEIVDGAGKPAVRITRAYELKPGTYDLAIAQKVENLTDHPIKLTWHQFGPTSLPSGTIRYGGDVRRVRFGYQLASKEKDPERLVIADDRAASLIPYATALDTQVETFANTVLPRWEPKTLWPSADSAKGDLKLAWAGMTGRYYTVAMYPHSATGGTPGRGDDKAFTFVDKVDRLAIPTGELPSGGIGDVLMGSEVKPIGEVVLRINTPEMTIEPGKSADLSVGVYAGPSSVKIIEQQTSSWTAGVGRVVLYTFGGPCGFCTFQLFAGALRDLLAFLHDHVVFDWALSIMLLVVCVRTVLHPITRWSQRRMYLVSKEMAKMAPKMKLIQEKYKDDPAKLREEQSRLLAENSGAYAGMAMGCIPAMLQTPVWIGLSAMIYFNYDLRHAHGFFGVFQNLSNHAWGFLGNLAEPDHLVSFGRSFSIPVIGRFMGPVDGLNLLPLILGVVFFLQQKYLQPPQTTPMTPEQEQQAKIMRVMTVVLFPLMMYNAPAGLALYFTTNSTLAILEIKWIRKKAEEEYKAKEAEKAAKIATRAGGVGMSMWDRKEKVAQPEGFMARLRRMAEDAQKVREQQARMKGKKK